MDYQDTFALVAKINSVRILLSLAANKDWALHQFDVKNIFLYGNLENEVYMDILLALDDSKVEEKVYTLKILFYGLKQSPQVWFERFTHAILRWRFKQSQGDHTLFIKYFS